MRNWSTPAGSPVAHALLRAGQSQHMGQALSPDKVTRWLIPVVGGLISTLVPGLRGFRSNQLPT